MTLDCILTKITHPFFFLMKNIQSLEFISECKYLCTPQKIQKMQKFKSKAILDVIELSMIFFLFMCS